MQRENAIVHIRSNVIRILNVIFAFGTVLLPQSVITRTRGDIIVIGVIIFVLGVVLLVLRAVLIVLGTMLIRVLRTLLLVLGAVLLVLRTYYS